MRKLPREGLGCEPVGTWEVFRGAGDWLVMGNLGVLWTEIEEGV